MIDVVYSSLRSQRPTCHFTDDAVVQRGRVGDDLARAFTLRLPQHESFRHIAVQGVEILVRVTIRVVQMSTSSLANCWRNHHRFAPARWRSRPRSLSLEDGMPFSESRSSAHRSTQVRMSLRCQSRTAVTDLALVADEGSGDPSTGGPDLGVASWRSLAHVTSLPLGTDRPRACRGSSATLEV